MMAHSSVGAKVYLTGTPLAVSMDGTKVAKSDNTMAVPMAHLSVGAKVYLTGTPLAVSMDVKMALSKAV